MKVYVNKKEFETPAGTSLAAFLAEEGLDRPGTAVAVGGKVVRRDAREAFILSEGTEITVIRAVCGG